MKHALSFDIEDWFHISGIPKVERRWHWDDLSGSIVEDKTHLILNILDRHGVKATFFVLGWIAEKYPELVRNISAQGHEIGTHGYWHYRVNTLSKRMFRRYLKQSIKILEDTTGSRVKGYRAPSFSITPGCEWAFGIMKELGLAYDASLFPAQRGHGGYDIEQGPQMLTEKKINHRFAELPMSMMSFGPVNVPFSGGGYLRFWPKKVLKFGFNQLEKMKLPGVVYLHPRDFAPDCCRVSMPIHRRFKCYTGLNTTEGKLKMLLDNFEFDTCEAVLKEFLGQNDHSEIEADEKEKTNELTLDSFEVG